MPPGLPQGLKSSFYALSETSTGSDEAGFLQSTPIHWLEPRKGPTPCQDEHCAAWDAHFTFHFTARMAHSLGPRGRYSTFGASSDGVTLAPSAFLPGKSKATGSETIFPFPNMQPKSNILHFWLLANPPPRCPHARPSHC